ncbi:MAG: GNAT family N-acetyltransferase [Burkholderiales bacterium]|nr:GNAT family N-acetyltransferase [Burkholderiales bacterium]
MLIFSNLVSVDLATLVETLNAAFADYPSPMRFDQDSLATFLVRRGFDPRLSVGAFDGGQLVALHLIASGEWSGRAAVYDCATGVLPEYRGQGLSRAMFTWLRPAWQAAGVDQCVLEVLSQNEAAQRSYGATGFVETGSYDCFSLDGLTQRGTAANAEAQIALSEDNIAPSCLSSWFDAPPSWQNSVAAIARSPQRFTQVRLLRGEQPVGIGLVLKTSGDVPFFAVEPASRGQGLGTLLLTQLARATDKPLRMINLTSGGKAARLVQQLGAACIATQRAMCWDLTSQAESAPP